MQKNKTDELEPDGPRLYQQPQPLQNGEKKTHTTKSRTKHKVRYRSFSCITSTDQAAMAAEAQAQKAEEEQRAHQQPNNSNTDETMGTMPPASVIYFPTSKNAEENREQPQQPSPEQTQLSTSVPAGDSMRKLDEQQVPSSAFLSAAGPLSSGHSSTPTLTAMKNGQEKAKAPKRRLKRSLSTSNALSSLLETREKGDDFSYSSSVLSPNANRKPSFVSTYAQHRPTPQASLADIAQDRYYKVGEKVPFDEDREHEFKQLHQVDKPVKRIAEYAGKYINAFLNTNGGVCYFGIDDDGVVHGVHLPRASRDAVRLHVDGIVEAFWPAVDARTCAIVFVPLAPPANPDFYVMELHVSKGTAPVYLMSRSRPTAYIRRAGSIYQMSMEMILQRMNFTMNASGSFFQPIQDKLTYKLEAAPRDFVGRKGELEEIIATVEQSEEHVKVVCLYGQGGVGKTTLSRRLAASMASSYPDGQFCIKLNGSTSKPTEPYDAMVYTIRAFNPSIDMPSSATEVEGYYLSCFNQKRMILLLDDASTITQITSLIPRSTCLVIITSRRNLGLESGGEVNAVCVKKLGRLSKEEAKLMLLQMEATQPPKINYPHMLAASPNHQLQPALTSSFPEPPLSPPSSPRLGSSEAFSDGPSSTSAVSSPPGSSSTSIPSTNPSTSQATHAEPRLTEEQAERLAELCGYLPLALRVVGGTLAKQKNLKAATLIERLSKNEAEILRLEANTVEMCISASYDLLPPKLQRLFLSLSLFPGTFDEMAVAHVCGADESVIVEGLSELLTSSLLEFNPVAWRYHLHDTVRVFASITAIKHDEEYRQKQKAKLAERQRSDVVADENKLSLLYLWKNRFVEYFYNLLEKVNTLCKKGGDDLLSGFKLFDSNSHNIKEAMRLCVMELHKYDLFCGFARLGKYIFRTRLNPYSFSELYQSLLGAVGERSAKKGGDDEEEEEELQGLRAQRKKLSGGLSDTDRVLILNELGFAYSAQGKYDVAEKCYAESLRIAEEHVEDGDKQEKVSNDTAATRSIGLKTSLDMGTTNLSMWKGAVSSALNHLGKLYCDQCKYSLAERHLKRALSIRENLYSHLKAQMESINIHSNDKQQSKEEEEEENEYLEVCLEKIGESLMSLGAAYTQLGKYDEAEQLFKRALTIYKPDYQFTENPSSLSSSSSFPSSTGGGSNTRRPLSRSGWRRREGFREVNKILRRHVHVRRKGSDTEEDSSSDDDDDTNKRNTTQQQSSSPCSSGRHKVRKHRRPAIDYGLQVANCLDHLGRLLSTKSKYAEAKALHTDSLLLKKRLLGHTHLEVARTRQCLAKVLGMEGKYAEAIAEYQSSMEIRKVCLSPEHPLVANSLRHIAFLHFYTGDYDVAESMYLEALDMLKEVLGTKHLEVAIVLNDLGLIYNHQARYDESEPLFLRSLHIRKKLLGEQHPYVAVVLNNIGNLYRKQRKYEEAEKNFALALKIRENCFGEEHPEVARTLHNIATSYSAQKQYAKAKDLFERSLHIRTKVLGPDHPEVASVCNGLGTLHECQKDCAEALRYYRLALDLNRKSFGAYHPSIGLNLYKMGNCLRMMKQYAEAEPLLKEALIHTKKCFGGNESSSSSSSSSSSLNQRDCYSFRTLQSMQSLQKFYREWAEYCVNKLQSRHKTEKEEESEEREHDQQQQHKSREERKQLKKLRKAKEIEEEQLQRKAEENFKNCAFILKEMGKEDEANEVLKRMECMREHQEKHKRRKIEKIKREREMWLAKERKEQTAAASASSSSKGLATKEVVKKENNKKQIQQQTKKQKAQPTKTKVEEGHSDSFRFFLLLVFCSLMGVLLSLLYSQVYGAS
ncbi:NB-ARC domain-containing protein [Balamuthia mandrillaris]